MGITINGRFSEADKSLLTNSRCGVISETESEKENWAYAERGGSGLKNAVEFRKLIDQTKSAELQNILDDVYSREIEGVGSLMRDEQVKRVSESLTELDNNLNEYFENHREIRADKLDIAKKILPEYFITSEDDANGEYTVVLEPMWAFQEARRYLNVAARLNRGVLID